jgi:hypothetical protein
MMSEAPASTKLCANRRTRSGGGVEGGEFGTVGAKAVKWRTIDGNLVNGRVTIAGCDVRAWDVALQVEAGSVSGQPGEAYRAPLTDAERAMLRARLARTERKAA